MAREQERPQIQTGEFGIPIGRIRSMKRLESRKKWDELAETAKRFVSRYSHLPDGYYYRGLAKTNLGQYRGAIIDFNKAIKINADYREAYIQRGLTRSKMGKDKLAEQDLNLVFEKDQKIIAEREKKA